jgi:hypothetical protein
MFITLTPGVAILDLLRLQAMATFCATEKPTPFIQNNLAYFITFRYVGYRVTRLGEISPFG